MTRVHLAQLLRDLTSAHDYAFFSAPDEYMPSEICLLYTSDAADD